jgi:hypothetical protein
MARRLIITAGWFAAAILAVLVGLVAISVIGDGLTAPTLRPISEAEVARQLADEPSAAPAPSSPSPSPAAASATPATAAPRSFTTRGGSVIARCDAGRAVIVSMAPAQGFAVHERDRGPQDDEAEGEFRSTADGHDRIEVEVRCTGGVPALTARADD